MTSVETTEETIESILSRVTYVAYQTGLSGMKPEFDLMIKAAAEDIAAL